MILHGQPKKKKKRLKSTKGIEALTCFGGNPNREGGEEEVYGLSEALFVFCNRVCLHTSGASLCCGTCNLAPSSLVGQERFK